MATMWDMPMLPGEDSSGFSALPPRQKPVERREQDDPWRVQPGFGAARNRKLSSDPSFSVLVRCNDARASSCRSASVARVSLAGPVCSCSASALTCVCRRAVRGDLSGSVGRNQRRGLMCSRSRWGLYGR